MVQFSPCPKAQVYLAATYPPGAYRPEALKAPGFGDINADTPGIAVTQRAALVSCRCHSDWGFQELEALEYGS